MPITDESVGENRGIQTETFTIGSCPCGQDWYVFSAATFACLKRSHSNAPYDIFAAGAPANCSKCGCKQSIPPLDALDLNRPQSFLVIDPKA